MALPHMRTGYREPETKTDLGTYLDVNSLGFSLTSPGSPAIPPTPGPVAWFGQALKTIWNGTPTVNKAESAPLDLKQNQRQQIELKRNLASEIAARDRPKFAPSTPVTGIRRTSPLVQTPVSAHDDSIDDDIVLPHVLDTSTPMVKNSKSQPFDSRRAKVESVLFHPPTYSHDDNIFKELSPSKKDKSVTFNPAVRSILFPNITSSTNSSGSNTTNNTNSIMEIDQTEFEASKHADNTTYNQTLVKEFPGKFPKSVVIFPEEKSFAATSLTSAQTTNLSSLAAMIINLFAGPNDEQQQAGDPAHVDDQDLEQLIGNLTVTMKSLKPGESDNDTTVIALPAERDLALQTEELAANYRYTTQLLADNICQMIDENKLKDDLARILVVLKDQEILLKSPKTYTKSSPHNGINADLLEKLKSYLKESYRIRARKILDMPNTSNSALRSRIKRTRDLLFNRLEEPGVTKELLSSFRDFDSCDRTAMGEIQRSFQEMDTMSHEQASMRSEPNEGETDNKEISSRLQLKTKQADNLRSENDVLLANIKRLESNDDEAQRTIQELRKKVAALEEQVKENRPDNKFSGFSRSRAVSKETRPVGIFGERTWPAKENAPSLQPPRPLQSMQPLQPLSKNNADNLPNWRLEADMDTEIM